MMKQYFVLAGLLFVSTFLSAANDTSIPLLSIQGSNWTHEEIAYIKELHGKGKLTIATKISSAIYMPNQDGSISGFHYNVLKEFSDLEKIQLDIKLVSWSDYFYKEGKDVDMAEIDPGYSYVPTLIENVDLYLDGITALDWRERMFDIVKFVPSRQMIVSRKENKPGKISDLNNKVCVMVKNTSMERNLEKIKVANNINFTYLHTENFDTMDKMVSEGKADFTVYDSDRAFAALKNYKNLTIASPVSDPEIMGWAVNKKNKVLKSILEKYIKYAQEEGILDKYWKISYGVTFIQYLKILRLEK